MIRIVVRLHKCGIPLTPGLAAVSASRLDIGVEIGLHLVNGLVPGRSPPSP